MKKNICGKKVYILVKDGNTKRSFEIETKKKLAGRKRAYFGSTLIQAVVSQIVWIFFENMFILLQHIIVETKSSKVKQIG